MYNRYNAREHRYYRVSDDDRSQGPAPRRFPDWPSGHGHHGPFPDSKKPPVPREGGLSSLLGSILPKGMDAGDILLLLVFLFLYNETGDDDFLIMLAVMALSIIG